MKAQIRRFGNCSTSSHAWGIRGGGGGGGGGC